jgi:thiol-disulfide isomerase/thioredoxin
MPADDRPSRPGRRYSTFVGIAFIVLVAVATLNTLRTEGGGTLDTGTPLPEFAVPDARNGPLDKDAAIFQDDCETSENPCPSDAVRTPACEIPRQGAIRVCDLFDRPLVISFWFTRAANCLPTQDLLDRVAARYRGRVNFLSIDVRDDPAEVRQIVAEHRWRVPVGYDRDGAVSNLYRVGGCPSLVFAHPGGILAYEKVGELSEAELTVNVQRLIRESRSRATESR